MANNKTKNYSYQITLIPEPEGGYTVIVPGLAGCVSYGKTIEQATENAKEAIKLHLENLAAHRTQSLKKNLGQPVFTTFVQIQEPSYA